MKRACWLPWGILFLTLAVSWGQNPPPAQPAQLVLVFRKDPKEFKSLMLDKKPFASLEISMEYASIWPFPAGKHELLVAAAGAEDTKIELIANPKEIMLLILDLGSTADAAKKDKSPKTVLLQQSPLPLPEIDNQARVFAYVPPGEKAISGEVTHGDVAGGKVEMAPGKLTPLGLGKTMVSADGKTILLQKPGGPGNYVSVLLSEPGADVRAVSFCFEVLEQEGAPSEEKKTSAPGATNLKSSE